MLREPFFIELETDPAWSGLERPAVSLIGQRRIVVGVCVEGPVEPDNDDETATAAARAA